MDKTYQPHKIEQEWYAKWEQNGYFAPQGDTNNTYCIMIPPPNITGSLHMGHALQHTLVDSLIRYQRMQGSRTLWQMGTDHAGIATQMVVERQLAQKQIKRSDIGRDAFTEKVWQWKDISGGSICRQLRRMGSSLDWSRERFTMDDGLSNAVQEVFIRLYNEGLIYRGKRLVNWDPALKTAISDLEVESTEENGHLWHFRYPLTEPTETHQYLVVATTRPETMLGDSAIAVHPDDERYQSLIGKTVNLPLCDRPIPIIADHYVDREFGTGCVKITPAHDFNDYQVGQRHQLPLINIFNDNAHINNEAPDVYQGLDRFAARKQIVSDLDALNLVDKIEPHTLKVPRGDRSGQIIEPYLTDQWFVAIESLAKPAIEAVENGDIEFIPKSYENIYFSWMRDIQDWCISRQLWWGHRIPAWYDNNGKIYVGNDENSIREQHKLDKSIILKQDEDVLDTWFSSALWTFSTLDWPDQSEDLRIYHPTQVLATAHDIIFFWVARMIMMTLKFMGEVPFHKVYVHGMVRDSEGQKMSKTKGNGLDPIDLIDGISLEELVAKSTKDMMQPQLAAKIEKYIRKTYPKGIPAYGTDALRFTFCSLASTGRDIKFDLGRIEGYRNFCNKIYNAAQFVFMHTQDQDCGIDNNDKKLGLADQWILIKLNNTIEQCHKAFNNYRFDLLANTVYEFIWNEYCDWYLELCKPIFWDKETPANQLRGTRHTLITVLETLLRMAHPVMPFITEELWQKSKSIAKIDADTIMQQPYPTAETLSFANAYDDMQWLIKVIVAIRAIRGELAISPAKAMPVLFKNTNDEELRILTENSQFLIKLAKLNDLQCIADDTKTEACATQVVGAMEILVPLAGVIDIAAEQQRLAKEIEKLQKEQQRLQGKLGNASFVEKAPEAVVNKEKEKLAQCQLSLDKLSKQLDSLK